MKANFLTTIAETVFLRMRRQGLLEESRTGGYMTVLSLRNHPLTTPFLVAQIGKLTDPEKIQKYHDFSREKADRLRLNVAIGHRSSWQSRNPDADQWGGAIHAGDYVLSFSGLPELADEALMLAVARKLVALLSLEQAHQIADISDNVVFRQLVVT